MSSSAPAAAPVRLAEDRFSRFEAVEWWEQARLRRARILLVGAGALGNEVLKNLALLGVGHVVVVDMDQIELSNLSRSVLFRETDAGQPKAICAARAARSIYPEMHVTPLVGNVLADVGLGYFRWADVVIGALDNREARVGLNAACARVGRPWLDGGIDMLSGIVRGFAAPHTACYECTMSATDWQILQQRRSCSLLARRAAGQGGVPTSPTTASVVGAIQAQEVVKLLHGMKALLGRGFVFEGATHQSYTVEYPVAADCPWHEEPATILSVMDCGQDTTLQTLWHRAEQSLGPLEALDLSRELVQELYCAQCERGDAVLQAAEHITEELALCPVCGRERTPTFLHSFTPGHPLLAKTARHIGLPPWDVVWARRGTTSLGLEFSADAPWPAAAEIQK